MLYQKAVALHELAYYVVKSLVMFFSVNDLYINNKVTASHAMEVLESQGTDLLLDRVFNVIVLMVLTTHITEIFP